MDLFLIRHGQSANNALPDPRDRQPDPPLTDKGRSQAERLAAYLARGEHLDATERREEGSWLDELHTSPMRRAVETALPVAEALGMSARVWVDLHEMGGVYREEEEGVRGYPGLGRPEMDSLGGGRLQTDEVGEEGWWRSALEPFHIGRGRAIGVAEALLERAGDARRVGLISHGGLVSCLIQILMGQLPGNDFYIDHRNTAITRLRLVPGAPSILCYSNRLEHLSAAERT